MKGYVQLTKDETQLWRQSSAVRKQAESDAENSDPVAPAKSVPLPSGVSLPLEGSGLGQGRCRPLVSQINGLEMRRHDT